METITSEETRYLIRDIAIDQHLDLVMLFGSYAKGRAVKESDIDIGVLKKTGLSHDDEINLNHQFSELFKSNNVNVSIISSNNPLLMYNILAFGKILYQKEDDLAYRLKLYAWKLLAESKSFRDHSFSLVRQKIISL